MRRRRFILCQAVILAGLLTSMIFSAVNEDSRRVLPTLRDVPRTARPLYNDPRVVTDSQLTDVLYKTHPRFQTYPTKINYIDHAIRMWGVNATFPDSALSGRQMLKMLVHHPEFKSVWGKQAQALLELRPDGVAVATQEGRSTVSHIDHLIGTFAEIGVPLSQEVTTATDAATVRDMLRYALRNFRLNQKEYEWTVLAVAFYTADTKPWMTCEGQDVSFDALAERLMRQPQPQGVCYGNHRLYTLVMLLRIDQQVRAESPQATLLSDSSREAVLGHLTEMTRRLCASQSAVGFWDGNWPNVKQPVPDPETDTVSRCVLATGHALEWWAMAPEQVHPPRETVVRAAQWLVRTIEGMDAKQIEDNYTFLTHAVRALALWRGCFPAEFEAKNVRPPFSS